MLRRFLFSLALVGLLTIQSASAQSMARTSDEPTSAEYLALQDGNVWEYQVVNEVDGERVGPSVLRFTIFDRQSGPGAFTDYLVRVDQYHEGKLMRNTLCRFRTNGQKPFLISTNRLDRRDCAYQSPVLATDLEQNTGINTVQIGNSAFDTAYIGVYQQFWSNQSGESGYITNHYAHGLGLYRYENRKNPSALDPDASRTSWVGELVFARIDGDSYGTSSLDIPPSAHGPSN